MRPFLTPKWIVSHLFVLAMIVAMTSLGFWQLRRLDERRDRNDEVGALQDVAPADLANLLTGDGNPADHTPTIVRGDYLDEHSFLVANRTFQSQAGSWLVTPMRLGDGNIVVVSRGWVPRLWASGDDQRAVGPPGGTIEILGRVFDSVDNGRIAGPGASILPELSRLDLDRVEELTGLDVVDVWVQLERQAPPLGDLPIPVPRASLDEGPHLAYAFQWFFFSGATLVAYGLILRRRRQEAERQAIATSSPL